ncbi:unnamed protein product [Effrenium voratum]|nr:unnamed protein product [Effrenium voratum]
MEVESAWQLALSAEDMDNWKGQPQMKVVKLGAPARHVLLVASAKVYALDARCGHRGGPLAAGDLEDLPTGLCVRCPWHGRNFRLETGHEVLPDGSERPSQRTFPTELLRRS